METKTLITKIMIFSYFKFISVTFQTISDVSGSSVHIFWCFCVGRHLDFSLYLSVIQTSTIKNSMYFWKKKEHHQEKIILEKSEEKGEMKELE